MSAVNFSDPSSAASSSLSQTLERSPLREPAEGEVFPLKIENIPNSGAPPFPPHFTALFGLNGEADFVSVHEWAARLLHVLLVETGFFPVDGEEEIGSPQALVEMSDQVRIPEFSRKLRASSVFSDQGIYALKYKVLLGLSEEDSWSYELSEVVNVTMLIKEDKVIVTALHQPKGEGATPVTLQFTFNIEEFFVQKAKMVPVKLKPDQWMRKFEVNYSRLSLFVKSKFCYHLMDLMDGILLERRGLFSVPYLVLVKILKKSDIQTILSLKKTCTYFFHVVMDNQLWKFLLKRDFPKESLTENVIFRPIPIGPPPLGAPESRVETAESDTSSVDNSQEEEKPNSNGEEPDYYEMYKQKYALKHRRLQRIHSFPARFFPTLRIGRRFPSIPFHLGFH